MNSKTKYNIFAIGFLLTHIVIEMSVWSMGSTDIWFLQEFREFTKTDEKKESCIVNPN